MGTNKIPGNRNQQAFGFFWWTGAFAGQNETVELDGAVGNTPIPKTTVTFDVYAPTVTLANNPPQKQPFNNKNPASWYDFIKNGWIMSGAADFQANVQPPPNFAGDIDFLQMITGIDDEVEDLNNKWLTVPFSPGLDTQFPYGVNTKPNKTDDAPSDEYFVNKAKAIFDETQYSMYVIFKPTVQNVTTYWVPLRVLNWQIGFRIDNGVANKNSFVSVAKTDAPVTQYPHWSTFVDANNPPPRVPSPNGDPGNPKEHK